MSADTKRPEGHRVCGHLCLRTLSVCGRYAPAGAVPAGTKCLRTLVNVSRLLYISSFQVRTRNLSTVFWILFFEMI